MNHPPGNVTTVQRWSTVHRSIVVFLLLYLMAMVNPSSHPSMTAEAWLPITTNVGKIHHQCQGGGYHMNSISNDKRLHHPESSLSHRPLSRGTLLSAAITDNNSKDDEENSHESSLQSSSSSSSSSPSPSPSQKPNQKEYIVQVSYEGRSCSVSVRANETILAAMERSGTADQLALPSIPFHCRRGNCLTCTGRHANPDSPTNGIVQNQEGDGLSPYMSKQVQNRGYVLTCSSHVVSEGVQIELGRNDWIWKDLYQTRFEMDAMERQQMGREVLARAIRERDEQDIPRWAAETKAALDKSG